MYHYLLLILSLYINSSSSLVSWSLDSSLCNNNIFPNWGYLNIYGYTYYSSSSNEMGDQSSGIINILSTIGGPSIVLNYYNKISDFNINMNWNKLISYLYLADIDESYSLSLNDYTLGVYFNDVVEFIDINNNGNYDIDKDTFVSSIDLGATGWLKVIASNITLNNCNLYLYNVSTIDKIVSIQLTVTDNDCTYNSIDYTPKNSKIDISISNYPYLQSGSKLAISSFVASNEQKFASNSTFSTNSGQVTWASTADSTVGPVSVHATTFDSITTDDIIMSVFSATLNTQKVTVLSEVYHTFDTINPNYIYWDPTLAFTSSLSSNSPANHMVFIIVGVCVAVVIAALVLVVWKRDVIKAIIYGASPVRKPVDKAQYIQI